MSAVVCFGEALIDFLAAPESAPDAPRAYLRNAGGAPANVAVALARLGVASRFVGMLGADLFGDFLAAELAAAGVDTRGVRRTAEAKTALAFVDLDAEGERSFSFYRPPAADLLFEPAQFDAADFAGCAVFHVCSNSLTAQPARGATVAGMRRAREAGALVSMDLNLRTNLWEAGADLHAEVWPALAEAALVKLSRSEMDWLAECEGSDAAVLERLLQHRARLVVVTDGGSGPVTWHAAGSHGAYPVVPVRAVDTTGAGDAFVAGLLAQLLARGAGADDLVALAADAAAMTSLLRFASACGARATQSHGAFAAMPTHADVLAFLEQNP
ncbi:carbohydrate kinase family protein [Coralloluteibacterium stylophorae]|uniref:Carbohydrate kinase n=1 Tax=Coralloluteibacterium stylophorae TaxID=1776034 RepID=A0A8J7VT97_9GAMM|nr:carbohydrate kinase [Coralloluteibacterium stylophorae]MBS7455794.1 carbohydrate kinase [Coralloluteibacterium stylophorae]